MEVKYVKIYHSTTIIKEYDYTPYCWIPNEGTLMRLDSGKYNGIYKVTRIEYDELTQTVKIYIQKY